MRGFAKRRAEKAMEMKLGKTCLARCLVKLNAKLVLRRKQVAAAAKAAKSVVVDQLRHEEMILPAYQPTSLPVAMITRQYRKVSSNPTSLLMFVVLVKWFSGNWA